jgi:broad specificity phosphatase PhoE
MIRILAPGSKTLRQTRVLLLRHAETADPDRFHGAESDVGLGERGRRQAEEVALTLAKLHPHALYCSPMRRAVETAWPIGRACDLVPQCVASLHESRMGPLSGRSKSEAMAEYDRAKARWMAGDLDYAQPGAESYADIRRRAVPAFEELVVRHPGATIVVVAHGVVIRVVLTTLLEGFRPAHFQAIHIPNAGLNDLRHHGTHWSAVTLASPDPSLSPRPPDRGDVGDDRTPPHDPDSDATECDLSPRTAC